MIEGEKAYTRSTQEEGLSLPPEPAVDYKGVIRELSDNPLKETPEKGAYHVSEGELHAKTASPNENAETRSQDSDFVLEHPMEQGIDWKLNNELMESVAFKGSVGEFIKMIRNEEQKVMETIGGVARTTMSDKTPEVLMDVALMKDHLQLPQLKEAQASVLDAIAKVGELMENYKKMLDEFKQLREASLYLRLSSELNNKVRALKAEKENLEKVLKSVTEAIPAVQGKLN